jgi:hypothetical protein
MPIDPRVPPSPDPHARPFEALANLERRVKTLEAQLQGKATDSIPVVAVLPPAGRQGRMMMRASDSSVWKDTGTAWVLV